MSYVDGFVAAVPTVNKDLQTTRYCCGGGIQGTRCAQAGRVLGRRCARRKNHFFPDGGEMSR